MSELAKAYVQIVPSMEGVQSQLERELGDAGEEAGKKGGFRLGSAIKNAVMAAGIGEVIKQSVEAGSALQQSFGGLDTIYGEAADQAKEFAAQAAAMGISANDYAEQAVSFGASLKMAFGGDTTKAVEAANTAILDMTDNAAKMGTPLESIQNAYAGFAKQNYTMLDNLKLGYGGTKQEMERLLEDAQKISGVEYDIDNLGDVYDAIHVIQGELGLTGVAAQEASTTFSGSLGAMKAAAQNVLGNLALGENIWPSFRVLENTVKTFLIDNAIPMVTNILKKIPGIFDAIVTSDFVPTLISAGIGMLAALASGFSETIPELLMDISYVLIPSVIDTLIDNIPVLIEGAIELFSGLLYALPYVITDLLNALPDIVMRIGNVLVDNAPVILKAAGQMLGGIVKAIPDILRTALSAITSVGKYLVEGLWNGIKSVKDWVLNKIKGFGSSILSGIKGIFGIHSPSKEMEWMGEMLDKGLARGITGGIGNVEDAMGNLTTATLANFDPRINVGGGSAGSITNMGGISFTVYGAPGQDVEELADILMDKLQAAYDREGVALA